MYRGGAIAAEGHNRNEAGLVGLWPRSEMGHKATCREVGAMSSIPPKADIRQREWDVRLVPCVDGSRLAS
jgi:hypothetical protein